jgi:hypothetical protein
MICLVVHTAARLIAYLASIPARVPLQLEVSMSAKPSCPETLARSAVGGND